MIFHVEEIFWIFRAGVLEDDSPTDYGSRKAGMTKDHRLTDGSRAGKTEAEDRRKKTEDRRPLPDRCKSGREDGGRPLIHENLRKTHLIIIYKY